MPRKDKRKTAECHAKWYARNKTKLSERHAEWKRNNRTAIAEQRLAYRETRYGKELGKKYGISTEQYKTMWEKQHGLCAICANPETSKHSRSGEVMRLAVDHCHTSGVVRGLLCNRCNNGLGRFKDDSALLHKAILYLAGSSHG